MRRDTKLNFSIKWQLGIAFVVCGAVPVALHGAFGAPWWLALSLGLGVALFMAWYSTRRVTHTIDRLWGIASRLAKPGKTEDGGYQDELRQLVHSFDDFVRRLENSQAVEQAVAEELAADSGETIQMIDEHAIFKCTLSTGDPVSGEAVLLPRRSEQDLLRSTRLTGAAGMKMFEEAATEVGHQLHDLADSPSIGERERGIIEFQRMMLHDDSLVSDVRQCLDDGLSLPESLNTTFAVMVAKLQSSTNDYISARAPDCMDLKQRLLETIYARLNPEQDSALDGLRGKIVLCPHLYPSEVISLQRGGVKGLIVAAGTATSHAEILLQSFNIPSLVNFEDLPLAAVAGVKVFLDTINRVLVVNPRTEDIEDAHQQTVVNLASIIEGPITMASGEPVVVRATINNVAIGVKRAREYGADGVGLFRSEVSYIGRRDLPTEAELFSEYSELVAAFPDENITMRMLDLGSDKLNLQGIASNREENPCMGTRSMRLLLRRPDMFRNQLRAMLRPAHEKCVVLFPMISGWQELRRICEFYDKVVAELVDEGHENAARVRRGIMVEVPGVVTRFEDYVDDLDVFNIGSNDLTQYTLAADRNNKNVAEYYSTCHPSVLSMIEKVCRLGAERGKEVCLCGELSADVDLVPLLLGLGIRSFSAAHNRIPSLKHDVRRRRREDCERLAREALACRAIDEVIETVRRFG